MLREVILSESSNKKELLSQKVSPQESFCKIADALRLKNSYREAISNYLNAILIERENANSYYGLGLCYKNLENYTKAIKYLDKAAVLKPDFYEAYYELGLCHLKEGIPCGAIKNFVQAIRINPEKPDAILQLGIAHESCDEYDMALMIYQKLIENSPKFIKAYEHKAELLMNINNYKEASILLNKIVKLRSKKYE